MSEKSYGQIAYEARWNKYDDVKFAIAMPEDRQCYELAAQAVLAEYELRKAVEMRRYDLEKLALVAKAKEPEKEPITEAQYHERLLRALRAMG